MLELFLKYVFLWTHANLILNFLIAIPKKKSIIQVRISVSFQINLSPTPFIITDLTIIKNHFAGIKLEIILRGKGIFSIGKINPLNITVGKNMATNEINMADC